MNGEFFTTKTKHQTEHDFLESVQLNCLLNLRFFSLYVRVRIQCLVRLEVVSKHVDFQNCEMNK